MLNTINHYNNKYTLTINVPLIYSKNMLFTIRLTLILCQDDTTALFDPQKTLE